MSEAAAATGPIRTTLIDIGNCIGCRACQVACKQWNEQDGEQTQLESDLGFQNPATLSARTYTLIAFNEFENAQKPGGVESAFVMQRCLHCLEPACVSACPTTALHRQDDGPVSYNEDECIGCRYCQLACPWDVPTSEWNSLAPKISKCTHCADRVAQPVPIAFNGQAVSDAENKRFSGSIATPACVKACPADALLYGTRDEMLAEAHKRIADRPDRYIDHVYGEKELGGTSVLYISRVPFEKLGFPTYGEKPFPAFTKTALGAVPPAVIGVGAMLGAAYAFFRKRAQKVADAAKHSADHGHVEFEPLQGTMSTPFNWVLLLLMAFGAVTFVARFVLGLGGSTNLSDTYPWGLWILFDLVWIAVAAGAFAMAGIIYVFQRKDLYGLGRSAVLMGLLSYSFVMVTLLADLGLPWHSYQLALQAPEHSAMFEVSWCVGLYVTILLLEFLPVPFAHFGYRAGRGCVAAMERRLRGGGGDAVRLPAVAQPALRPRDGRDLRHARLGVPRARPERRADHARDRRGHAVDHAPELARLAVPADAEHARAAVVVSRDAGLVLPVVDRGGHRARDPDRHVDREGVAPPARNDAARLGRTDYVLVAARLPRVPPRRHGDSRPVRRSLRRNARHRLRGRDHPRRRRAAGPAGAASRFGSAPTCSSSRRSWRCSAWPTTA